ncbi:hypothetical protein [Photobacterium halotolerans]|nr:hypothetical protein [Photobacterium halotolerans]
MAFSSILGWVLDLFFNQTPATRNVPSPSFHLLSVGEQEDHH